ncbi:MAG: hypothetical protein ACLQVI_41540 [Polyangiaceae bacterium]
MGTVRPPLGRAVDDPYFAIPEACPFLPGSSPFRIKGWGYIGDITFYTDFVPGGIEAVAQHVKDSTIASFLSRTFTPDAWYDLIPKLYLSQAAARARGVAFDAHCREVSRYHAQDKFSGIYRPLLKVVSSEMIALWTPRLASSFYDFGTTESHVAGERLVRVVRKGVPRIAVQWWAAAASAYFEYCLETAGARIPHVRWLPTEPDGERLGMELVRMPLEITWAA